MLMNEMLNAAEQLNLLKLIYDNTWRAINLQAGTEPNRSKHSVARHVPRPSAAGKRKTKHPKPAKPTMVPVQPMSTSKANPQAAKPKPKPFNMPKGLSDPQRLAQPTNRTYDSQSQNSVNSLDPKLVGKVGVASRNTNTN